MKQHVRVAVIGGGVTGCSVLYHLAKAGWTDVALFERSELTSGSSWHAAGGTSAFAGDANMGFLQKYSFELYPSLEAESGQSCGFHHTGGLTLARSAARLEELTVHKAKTLRLGLEAEFLSKAEALDIAPILESRAGGSRALGAEPRPRRPERGDPRLCPGRPGSWAPSSIGNARSSRPTRSRTALGKWSPPRGPAGPITW